PLSLALFPLSLHDALPICSRASPSSVSMSASHRRSGTLAHRLSVSESDGPGLARTIRSQATASLTVTEVAVHTRPQSASTHRRGDRKSTRLNSSHVSISYA